MPEFPAAMLAHLEAVTGDAARLRTVWTKDGVLEFPYATPGMTSRIEGVDALVEFFGGARRWSGWSFEAVRVVSDEQRRLHVAEVHGEATWTDSGKPYVQDYVIWMELDPAGLISGWREYWDKSQV